MSATQTPEADKIEQYQAAVMAVVTCARILAGHDLDALIQAIQLAETMGPIVDPTLWKERSGAMQVDKELLQAALPLWKLARKQIEQHAQKQAPTTVR